MRIEWFDQYDAIFFDLDGTLYDDRQYDSSAYAQIAAYFAEPDLPAQLLQLKQRRGRLDGNLFDDYCRARGMPVEAAAEMVQIYRHFVPHSLQLDALMAQLLRQLESRKLFLLTNGRVATQTKKINALGLEQRFTRVYICDGKTWPFKPDPAVYFHARDLFGFERAVMVGDSLEIDQGFARNAGIEFFHYSVAT